MNGTRRVLLQRSFSTQLGDKRHRDPVVGAIELLWVAVMTAHMQLTELAQLLHKHLTCASPLHTQSRIEADTEFLEIEQALESPGTTIFIHGDLVPGRMPRADLINSSYVYDRNGTDDFIVIDEFDKVTNQVEQRRFANFIGQIAEQRTPIHFVLCRVSEAVREILGAHESCYANSKPERPESTHAVPSVSNITAHAVQTDLPHHMYVLSERLFWEMFEDPTFARSLH